MHGDVSFGTFFIFVFCFWHHCEVFFFLSEYSSVRATIENKQTDSKHEVHEEQTTEKDEREDTYTSKMVHGTLP